MTPLSPSSSDTFLHDQDDFQLNTGFTQPNLEDDSNSRRKSDPQSFCSNSGDAGHMFVTTASESTLFCQDPSHEKFPTLSPEEYLSSSFNLQTDLFRTGSHRRTNHSPDTISSDERKSSQPIPENEEGCDTPEPQDEEKAPGVTTALPPSPVGFWDAGLAATRRDVAIKYSQTLFILCIAIMCILSIYWGVLFTVKPHLSAATVAVVDFDGIAPFASVPTPVVGPAIVASVHVEMNSRSDALGYKFESPSKFENDPMKVRAAVLNEDYWAAIIINSNASALLRAAVSTGNTSYDPQGAAQIIYNQARDIESFNFYVIPALSRLARIIPANFGTNWTRSVFTNSEYNAATYSRSPQALSPAIGFSMYDLRPFDPPSAIPTITIGLIYLIIIAFFSFTFFIPTHMKFVLPNPSSPHPPLKFHQLIIYRWLATICAYLFLSLSYSIVSLAFQIPFSNTPPNGLDRFPDDEVAYNANYLGHATFFVYWMLNFFGMGALGLACENMAMLLTALSPLPFSALFLIWWVITNVSTGFYALELAPKFYRWGYAWPLRQIVEGSKTLVFGTKSRLGLNFGILIAWIIVDTALFPVACWVMRWKTIKDKKAAAAKAANSTPAPTALKASRNINPLRDQLVKRFRRR